MLASAVRPANANGVKLPRAVSMPARHHQYAPSVKTVRDRTWSPRRHRAPDPVRMALIGDFADGTGGHLTAFHRAEHAGEMTVADVGETDFAVIVYREEDQWEADALPSAVTADLDDFVQALRRQPSMGGTIGFADRLSTISHETSAATPSTPRASAVVGQPLAGPSINA